MSTESDYRGRSFEYLISDVLVTSFGGVFTGRAKADNIRDSQKFSSLDRITQSELTRGAKAIPRVLRNMGYSFTTPIVDRLPDDDAKNGDPTDIRISHGDAFLNLSIKNNHFALKHQRPNSLMQQLGFDKNSAVDLAYRRKLNSIYRQFDSKATALVPNASAFNELRDAQADFIDCELYRPVCTAVAQALGEHASTPNCASHYFEFLVGKTNFLKIIRKADSLIVEDFSSVTTPTSYVAKLQADTKYIGVSFDNGWHIKMRLHTADTWLSPGASPSLKFDTQFDDQYDVPLMTRSFSY